MSDTFVLYESPVKGDEKWAEFTAGGSAEVVAGDVITGDTSGKTAIVTKVHRSSGTWAASSAKGSLFIKSQSGAFTAGEACSTPTQAAVINITGAFMPTNVLVNAVSLIDNTPPDLATSPPFEVSRFGFSNFMIRLENVGSVGTDNLICELFGSVDGQFKTSLANADADRVREITVATTAKDSNWEITDFPFPWAKLALKSAGATDSFTVLADFRRWRFATTRPLLD